jgi:hypothetical protein
MLKPIKVKPPKSPNFDFDAHIVFYTEFEKQMQQLYEKTIITPNSNVPIWEVHTNIPEIRLKCHFWDCELHQSIIDIHAKLLEWIYFLKCAKAYHSKEAKEKKADGSEK